MVEWVEFSKEELKGCERATRNMEKGGACYLHGDTDRRTRHRRVMAPTEITVLVKAKQEKVKANATSVFAPPLQ